VETLTGRFSDHHAYLARMHLEAIERHDATTRSRQDGDPWLRIE
jgi:hypothetical protein